MASAEKNALSKNNICRNNGIVAVFNEVLLTKLISFFLKSSFLLKNFSGLADGKRDSSFLLF